MPAQLEEMIVAANLRHLQQGLPDLRDGDLDITLWRRVFAHCQCLRIRSRQCLLVELTVGGQREAVQCHKSTGHHVVGQRQQQPRTQVSRDDLVARLGDHIGHQALVTRLILADQHQRFADRIAGSQHRLNFSQLDTEATDLDLVVVAAQVIETAVSHPATQVAGSVQARLRILAERVRQETLGGQRFTVQVAPRDTGTADIQLANNTHRHRLATCIEYIQLQIGNAHTDRTHARPLRICRHQGVVGHMHRGFGDAIHVHQLRTGVDHPGVPRLEHPGVQRFATKNHLAQGMSLIALALGVEQLAERARSLVEHRHFGAAQQRVAVLRGAADQLRHDKQTPAVQQRTPDFPDREVEGE
ncbi:Uncharacterized protein AC517_0554 [Pseudomonas syringae pv. syringae]|nr:Uncharacterized protein AC517_0554 [Pseudomonas syringae pv. syringae]